MENNNFTPEENKKMNDSYEIFLKNRTIKKGLTEEEVERIITENNNLELENVQKQSEINKLIKSIGLSRENIDYYKDLSEKYKTEKKEIDNEHKNTKIVANEKTEEIKIENKHKTDFEPTGHPIFHVLAVIFCVGSFFLYFATIGTSLVGLKEGDLIFRSDILSIIFEEPNINTIIVPVCSSVGVAFSFIAMKKIAIGEKRKAFGYASLLLIVDFGLGYKITKEAYEQRFLEGLKEVPWEFSFFISDSTFWWVFLVNFIFYIGASTFIKYSLNLTHTENINSTKNIDEINKRIEGERQDLKEKINDFNNKITKEQESIENNQRKISELEGKIEENNFRIKKNKEKVLQLTK